MGTKQQELMKLAKGEGCLGKAASDEPIFILRAQDALAPGVIRQWAMQAAVTLTYQHPKVIEAVKLAEAMEAWPTRKKPD